MFTNVCFIVGNEMKEFSENENVVPLSKMMADLKNCDHTFDPNTLYVVSQGVSPDERQELKIFSQLRSIEDSFLNDESMLAPKELSHKHDKKNTMISTPKRLSDTDFIMDLLLDEKCADMSDHVTGQHIQGMVLIEAARQSFLAVTEKFFNTNQATYFFTFNSFNIRYNDFVFPIGAKIHYSITEMDISKANRIVFAVNVEIQQVGKAKSACSINASFSALENSRMTKSEQSSARKAISHGKKYYLSQQHRNFQGDGELQNVS